MLDVDVTQSNLWQILVPEEFFNQTYDKLFTHLLEKNLVCIGLYRLPGATDNRQPYCYTNPDPKTLITHKDRVFVLGIEIPNDLMLDVKRSKNTALAKLEDKPPEQKKAHFETGGTPDFYGSKALNSEEMQAGDPTANSPGKRQSDNNLAASLRKALTSKFAKAHSPSPQGKHGKKLVSLRSMISLDDNPEQTSSMEFMLRSIARLESKLSSIEDKISNIKQTIAKQDVGIKRDVTQIRNILIENMLKSNPQGSNFN